VDFGYICPTELMVVEDKLHEIQQEECEVLAISTGSIIRKVALMSLEKEKGGVAGIKFVPPRARRFRSVECTVG
jgi:alkyl hydroperoxide reductase subunit AhpC